MTSAALRVADRLSEEGIELEVVNASTIKPLDGAALKEAFDRHIPVFTLEEHVLMGGFGSAVLEWSAANAYHASITPLAVPDRFVQHGDHKRLLKDVGLDDEGIMNAIRCTLQKETNLNHG